MADIGVSYNINYSPKPVGVNIDFYLRGKDINIRLGGVPALAVTATPRYSANILSNIASTIGTPLVNVITLFFGTVIGNFINGKTFKVSSVPAIPYTVEGTKVTLNPSGLSSSNFKGMLKVSGDFKIS